MRVVSDTSPVSNLAIIGRLSLLRERYGRVVIPRQVEVELNRLSHVGGKKIVVEAIAEGWLVVEPLHDNSIPTSFLQQVDRGEAAAICLAETTKADKLLMDDRAGRALARVRGLKIGGLLAELVFAKLAGHVASVRNEMERLRKDANFFISADIMELILTQADE